MASPADLGFDLLPPDPGVLNPDLSLEASLAPVVQIGQPDVQPIGRGWAFDFLTGQFVRNGAAPAGVSDIDQMRVWIEKTLRTARYAHPIYTAVYGVDDPDAQIGSPYDGALIAAWQQAIVDALMVHDRIAAVDGFAYAQAPYDDGLYVSFNVTLDSDDQQQALQINSFPLS
jgi:hypothetical protein